MKFSHKTEPRQPRPRPAAEILRPHPEHSEQPDVRKEIRVRLEQWRKHVEQLYKEYQEGKKLSGDLYHVTALLQQLSTNVGAPWTPPEQLKTTCTKRAKRLIKAINNSFEKEELLEPIDSSFYGYPVVEVQGIVQTVPEMHLNAGVSNKGAMGMVREIIDELKQTIIRTAIIKEYAYMVLRPNGGHIVRRKNTEAGYSPQSLFESIDPNDNPRKMLPYLRLLYPDEQQEIVQLWTTALDEETEREFFSFSDKPLLQMEEAWYMMVMHARDARLVDGQVVTQFNQKSLQEHIPVPPRPHQ